MSLSRVSLRVPIWMIVFWGVVFACTVASTNVGALIMGDTLPALLLTSGALLLAGVLVLAGIGMSLFRSSWRPFCLTGVNLLASVGASFLALLLVLNVPVIDLVRGQPLIVAAYVGTQNSATLTLRRDGKMDLLSTGWPGASRFDTGTYERQGSELLLKFETKGGSDVLPYGLKELDRAVIVDDEIRLAGTSDRPPRSLRIVRGEPDAMDR